MPDYKEMYLKLFRASEQAVNTLIQAQRECKELYISQPELDFKVLPLLTDNKKSMEEESFQIHAFVHKFELSWDCSQTHFESLEVSDLWCPHCAFVSVS